MRIIFLGVVATLVTAAGLWAQKSAASEWIGQRVIMKTFKLGFSLEREKIEETELKQYSGNPLTMMCTIEVIDEKGDDIRVRNSNNTAWMKKSDFVLLRDAEDHFGKQLAMNPKDAEAYALMALVYIGKADIAHTTKMLDEAIKISPTRRDYQLLKLAVIDEDKKNPEAVHALATELLKSDADDVVARSSRCSALLNLDRYQEALEDAEVLLKKNPMFEPAIIFKACCYLELKKEDEGIRLLEEIMEKSPENPHPYKQLSHYWIAKSNNAKARIVVTTGLKHTQDEPYLFFQDAYLALEENKPEIAIASSTIVIEKFKAIEPKAYWYRGCAYIMLGKQDLALADINEYIDTKPNDARAYQIAFQLNRQQGKHATAMKHLLGLEKTQLMKTEVQFYKALTHWDLNELEATSKLMKEQLQSENAMAKSIAAYFLSTCSTEKYRNGKLALEVMDQLSKTNDGSLSLEFNIIHSAAEAENGLYDNAAIKLKLFLVESVKAKLTKKELDLLNADIKLYESKKPKRLAKCDW